MKGYQQLALALFLLLLAGCSAGQTPSPSETPTPTETGISQETIDYLNDKYGLEPPSPSPVPETAQEKVLYYVDEVLAGEKVHLMCWLSSGSGPTSVDLAPYREDIRALFSQLEWSDQGNQYTTVHEGAPADWGYFLQADDSSINFFGGTQYNGIDIAFSGPEATEPLSFAAKGASSLAMDLVNLYPGPHIRFCLAEVPAEGITNTEELADAYAAAFEQFYLDSGDITDFERTALEVTGNSPDSDWHAFRMSFSVTPADPNDPYWSTLTADSSGRYGFDYEMHLLLDEDGIYRCDWFQEPNLSR